MESDAASFTIPGHKRRAAHLDAAWGRMLDADVPLYGGAGTIKGAHDVLRAAEARAARLWGADLARFSTGGSTHANQVLCLTLARAGGVAVVARNAHRSIVSGLALAGLRPVWLPVPIDDLGAPLGVDPEAAEAALAEHPDAVGLWITDPTYVGTIGARRTLADIAHAHGVPLVVDQAWGAHLGFAPGYPEHALDAGADAVVTSAHKMLPAFSQGAIVLARSERIDPDRLDRAFDATHTTSPSAAILASIDASCALLGSTTGQRLLVELAGLVRRARTTLRTAGLTVLGPEHYPPGRYDPAKLVLRLGGDGPSGVAVEDALLRHGIAVELADRETLVAQVGLTDDDTTVGRLVDTVLTAWAGRAGGPRSQGPDAGDEAVALSGARLLHPPPIPPQRLTPREAFLAAHETVPRDLSIGRIVAELVAPYPPGIPVLVPGEEVTAETLAHLDAHRSAGTRIAYAADPSLETLQVVTA